MTDAEMRQALNLGAEWQVIWTGANPLDSHQHLCCGLYGPGGTYVSKYVTLTYQPTGRPGLEAAWCARCRELWVRQAARP